MFDDKLRDIVIEDKASGKQRLNGSALVRADLYGQAARGNFEEMRRRMAKLEGMTEEMRVLGEADHCDDCLSAAGHWTPIGTLPRIGDSQCVTNCRCTFKYRKGNGENSSDNFDPRQGMGAALSSDIERAQRRLEQTKAFTPEYSARLKTAFDTGTLPKQELHFNKHKGEFSDLGITTKQQYVDAFNAHVNNPNLKYYTVLRYEKFSKQEEAMWYLLDVKTGIVAQYNETRESYWSFFRHEDPDNFVRHAHGGMLQAVWNGETWEFLKP